MKYESLLPAHLLHRKVTVEGIDKCKGQEKRRITENDKFVVDLSHRRGTQKQVCSYLYCLLEGT